jgi:hypothetical protein
VPLAPVSVRLLKVTKCPAKSGYGVPAAGAVVLCADLDPSGPAQPAPEFEWINRFRGLGPAFYTELGAQGLPDPHWVATSEDCARLLGFPDDWATRDLYYGPGGKSHEPRGPSQPPVAVAVPRCRRQPTRRREDHHAPRWDQHAHGDRHQTIKNRNAWVAIRI